MKKVPPPTLYHYTSGAGLRGILASNSLWFTEYKFLNDATELEYGASLALEIAQDIVHSSDLKMFRSDVESTEIHCFMTCFCEADDLLSQWRGYAKDTVGYSIGFNTTAFERDSAIEPLSVLYDKSEQRMLLERAINAWNSSRDEDVFSRVDASSDLLSAVFRCKNPAFSEEREWRLIHAWNGWRPGSGPLGRKFRDAGKFMVPYLERALPLIEGIWKTKVLDLDSIRCGPSADPKRAQEAVASLLWESGYHSVKVRRSEVPLRW